MMLKVPRRWVGARVLKVTRGYQSSTSLVGKIASYNPTQMTWRVEYSARSKPVAGGEHVVDDSEQATVEVEDLNSNTLMDAFNLYRQKFWTTARGMNSCMNAVSALQSSASPGRGRKKKSRNDGFGGTSPIANRDTHARRGRQTALEVQSISIGTLRELVQEGLKFGLQPAEPGVQRHDVFSLLQQRLAECDAWSKSVENVLNPQQSEQAETPICRTEIASLLGAASGLAIDMGREETLLYGMLWNTMASEVLMAAKTSTEEDAAKHEEEGHLGVSKLKALMLELKHGQLNGVTNRQLVETVKQQLKDQQAWLRECKQALAGQGHYTLETLQRLLQNGIRLKIAPGERQRLDDCLVKARAWLAEVAKVQSEHIATPIKISLMQQLVQSGADIPVELEEVVGQIQAASTVLERVDAWLRSVRELHSTSRKATKKGVPTGTRRPITIQRLEHLEKSGIALCPNANFDLTAQKNGASSAKASKDASRTATAPSSNPTSSNSSSTLLRICHQGLVEVIAGVRGVHDRLAQARQWIHEVDVMLQSKPLSLADGMVKEKAKDDSALVTKDGPEGKGKNRLDRFHAEEQRWIALLERMKFLAVQDQQKERQIRARHLTCTAQKLIQQHKRDQLPSTGQCAVDAIEGAQAVDEQTESVSQTSSQTPFSPAYQQWLSKVRTQNLYSLIDDELVGAIQAHAERENRKKKRPGEFASHTKIPKRPRGSLASANVDVIKMWATAQENAGGGPMFRTRVHQSLNSKEEVLATGLQVWRDLWRERGDSSGGAEYAIRQLFRKHPEPEAHPTPIHGLDVVDSGVAAA